jgi:hypothetical protein
VLTLPDSVDASDALAAIDRLRDAGALTVLGAWLIERQDDPGALTVVSLLPATPDRIDSTVWRWLLAGGSPVPEPAPDAGHAAGPVAEPGLSQSFLVEVSDALRTARKALAFVVGHLDPGAAVAELRHLPEARLVYGALPPHIERHLLAPD